MNGNHKKTIPVVATLVVIVCHGLAQEKVVTAPVIRPQPTTGRSLEPFRDVRVAVEAWSAAALAGKTDEAAALAVSGTSPGSDETIESLRQLLDGQSLDIYTVIANSTTGNALAISHRLTLPEPDPDGRSTGRLVFTLTRNSGKWLLSDVDFDSLEEAAEKIEAFGQEDPDARQVESSREVKVFHLAHADAQSMCATLSPLWRDVAVAADQRSNTIIATGPSEELAKIEALLLRLDKPYPNQAKPPSPDDFLRAMRGKRHEGAPPQPAALHEKYLQLEREAAELAKQYRDLPGKGTRARTGAAAVKTQLAETVKQVFDARQKLQRAELAALRQRLARIEQQIASRERIKEEIIDRRIEDLLNPEYRWDGSEESTPRPTASAGVTQTQSLQEMTQTGDYIPADAKFVAQILFSVPHRARVTLPPDRTDAPTIELPARVNIFGSSSDGPVPFRLNNIPAHAGLELSGTIDLAPVCAQTRAFLQHNVIPIEFHNEDMDQASSGKLVTKVIYLPKPEHQEFAMAGIETIVSTRLDPGLNPITEADRRGHVLATVRLGNRVPDDPSEQTATNLDSSSPTRRKVLGVTEVQRHDNVLAATFTVDVTPPPGLQFDKLEVIFECDKEPKSWRVQIPFGFTRISPTPPAEVHPSFPFPLYERRVKLALVFPDEESAEAARTPLERLATIKAINFRNNFGMIGEPPFDVSGSHPDIGNYRFLLRLSTKPDPVYSSTSKTGTGTSSLGHTRSRPETKPDADDRFLLLEIAERRWELLQLKMHSPQAPGEKRVTPSELLSGAEELLEARLGVAQSTEAHRAALYEHIILLKKTKKIAETHVQLGIGDQTVVLELQAALLKAERQLEAEPVKDPSDAIVWIEAIMEERQADGPRESEALYMFGAVVSPDGLIATVLEKDQKREQVFEQFRTATVSSDHRASLVAYKPEYGVALLKIDATGRPFLALAAEPIAANRRLTVHALGGFGPNYASHTSTVRVSQTNHRIGETDGFFEIAAPEPFYGLHVGAALVSANGHMQGIIGRQTLPLEAVDSEGSRYDPERPKVWAVPANVIAELIREYHADSPATEPRPAPNASSATKATSTANWAANMFAEARGDLGDVAPGAKVQHRLVVMNPYVEDVRIASISPTISPSKQISVPQVTRSLLKTSEKGEIIVEVDAGQDVGVYTESLTVAFHEPFDAEFVLPLTWSVHELEPVEEELELDGAVDKFTWDVLGVKLRPLSQDALPNRRFRGGMQIIEVRKHGAAAEAKLQVDDVIVGIHHWETISLNNVVYILELSDLQPNQYESSEVKCWVLRGDETLSVTVPLRVQASTAD